MVIETESKMSRDEFRAWRKRHSLTQSDACRVLGLRSRTTLSEYEQGSKPIPEMVRLATVGYDLETLNLDQRTMARILALK